jgi:hypothetical protein
MGPELEVADARVAACEDRHHIANRDLQLRTEQRQLIAQIFDRGAAEQPLPRRSVGLAPVFGFDDRERKKRTVRRSFDQRQVVEDPEVALEPEYLNRHRCPTQRSPTRPNAPYLFPARDARRRESMGGLSRTDPQHANEEGELRNVEHYSQPVQNTESSGLSGVSRSVDTRRQNPEGEEEERGAQREGCLQRRLRREERGEHRRNPKKSEVSRKEGAHVCCSPVLRQDLEDDGGDDNREEQHHAHVRGDEERCHRRVPDLLGTIVLCGCGTDHSALVSAAR